MHYSYDMGVNFLMAYFDEESLEWVVQPPKIASRYFSSWFIIDFVSILPFNVVDVAMGDTIDLSQFKAFRIIRLLRLAKLLRVLKASRIFARWQS